MSDAPEEPPSEGSEEPQGHGDGRPGGSESGGPSTSAESTKGGDSPATEEAADGTEGAEESSDAELEALRREVEEKYDFENFGPADMAEMSLEEWQVAFDPETWITGEALLDRVENDLETRIANREVFARLERETDPQRLVAYSDEGYAIVYPDGSVAGEGTVLRDVKPSVALCSMESYDVPEAPADGTLPEPEEVPEQSGELGNLMLQVIAGIQLLASLVLFGAGLFTFGDSGSNAWLLFLAAFGFLAVGLLLFFTVANARLSDAFRAEEYRNRLRAVGTDADDRPDFLPPEAAEDGGDGRSITGAFDGEDDESDHDAAADSDDGANR